MKIPEFKLAFFLAVKSIIKGNKAVSTLMVFILSLAFINLIFVSSILDGVLEAINRQIVENMVSNVVIDPQEEPTRKDFIARARQLREEIEMIPGVTATASHYKLAGTFSFDKEKNGRFKYLSAQIIGVNAREEKKISSIADHLVSGEYLEEADSAEIVLGAEITGGFAGANEFTNLGGVKTGDTVKVTFTNGVVRSYKVKGIFLTKFDMVDRTAFISEKEAESVLAVDNSPSQILVKLNSTGLESQFIEPIQSLAPNLKVRQWREYMGPMKGISKSFDIIILMITVIGIVVAAITIFILIYVNVVNKRRQIGILKAIGIKQQIVICSYVMQALFYAVAGVALGLFLTFNIVAPYFAAHPLDLAVGDVSLNLKTTRIIFGAGSLVIASIVAGFLPSWRAVRENILQAIWGA